jgi:hypothetical protein
MRRGWKRVGRGEERGGWDGVGSRRGRGGLVNLRGWTGAVRMASFVVSDEVR